MPKISVILTSRNHRAHIGEAIQSVLNQTFSDFELIIWDDASTDNSWDVIKSYPDARIKAFRNEIQRYGVYGVNKAIAEIATGEYIAIHHSDDIWEPEKLEKQVRFLEGHPEFGAVFSWVSVINNDGKILENHLLLNFFAQANRTRHEWLRHFLFFGNALCHPSVLIRRQCYQDCGLYRLGMWQLPDFDMWTRLCLKYEIHVLPEPLVRFRWHGDGSNSSAPNTLNLNRLGFESWLVLEHYEHITLLGDVLKILPDAAKYLGATESDAGYVLARALLDITPFGDLRLFAQQMLFRLLSNPERAERIRALHGFDHMDFMEITQHGVIFAQKKAVAPAAPNENIPPLTQGIRAFNAGDYAAAFEPLAAALEQEPDNPLPSAYLAFVAAHQGLIQEARNFIAECERIAPHRADLIAAFGETLLKAEQANIAAEYLEKAIGKQPDLYAAYPALGQSLHLCGRHEEAAAILQSVAQIPSAAQTSIRETLLQIQMECGGDSPLKSSMEDGLLRIRITNQCNAQCRFCGIRAWPKHEQSMSMDKTVLYEYCKPLYEKIKILLLTGGDPIAAKEGFNFSRFISENYPRVTLFLESNGIAFTKKWQELAKDNLCTTHFSINGSSAQIYEAGCWASPGGKAYNKTLGHIESYIALLRQSGLEVFAPDISMVINKDTASDVRAFVRKGLEMGVRFCLFYFDYTENNMASPYFGRPETSRPALAELMKLERVLAKKFFIYFRLWIPLKESELLQPQIDAIPLHELEAEYADILVCAQGRSMLREHEERQRIRAERGKKIHTWDEDWTPTIRQTQVGGQTICAAPYQMLDIYPHHAAECCGWITPRIRLDNWIQNGAIDWNRLFNSQQMKTLRQDMLNGGYSLCQKCCPLNPRYNELCSPHRYGFDRVERPCGEIEAPPRTPTPQNLPPQEL